MKVGITCGDPAGIGPEIVKAALQSPLLPQGVEYLVIGGTKDPGTTPADAELIARSIPGATLKLLECAHMSNVERADEFNATVLEFLAA